LLYAEIEAAAGETTQTETDDKKAKEKHKKPSFRRVRCTYNNQCLLTYLLTAFTPCSLVYTCK